MPYRGSPNISSFANQQISIDQFEAVLLGNAEMHVIEFRQVKPPPKNIFRSKEGSLIATYSVCFRNLLALLHIEQSIKSTNSPIRRKLA